MTESDFRKIKRILIQRKIDFVPSDRAEPHFSIRGDPFTTQELIQLERAKKLTNLDLSEIIEAKRREA
jgi:hypothetical protein